MKIKRMVWIRLVTLLTLVSGMTNLYSVVKPAHQDHKALFPERWRELVPLEFLHAPRSITLLIGFALVISGINLLQRKRRAYQIVLSLAIVSFIFHQWRGHGGEQTGLALAIIVALILLRKSFNVPSSAPNLSDIVIRLMIAAGVSLIYGIAGFWLLEHKEFGVDFNWVDSIHRSVLYLTFIGDPHLVPHSRYAAWFLDSLYLISSTVISYAIINLFRPIVYRYRTLPQEAILARSIMGRHGRSSLDFFKLWPDKSCFFNERRSCFISYCVGAGFALALGDPVGIEAAIPETIAQFKRYCEDNGWGVAFHQVTPDFLPFYREEGFKKLKLGDEAIVDLTKFSLEGKAMKRFRHRVNVLEKDGIRIRCYEPPVSSETLKQLGEVSDEWLQLPGRRERTFTLGQFHERYLRKTPIVTAEDESGVIFAFVNLIPSGKQGEATFDLMRHRLKSPNGVMDYLFTKLIINCKEQGYSRFNFGLAAMSGFTEREQASSAERAVHLFFQRLNFLFSFKGLKDFKSKYADIWEPRYLIYRQVLDLPRIAIALSKVSEENTRRINFDNSFFLVPLCCSLRSDSLCQFRSGPLLSIKNAT